MEHSERFLKIVADAKLRVKELSVAHVAAKLQRQDPMVLCDVREDSEWNDARIPGAIHLGKGVIERDVESRIANLDSEIVLYCGGGYRSTLAADNLQRMGYKNVWSMDGGFRGWESAGFSIDRAKK